MSLQEETPLLHTVQLKNDFPDTFPHRICRSKHYSTCIKALFMETKPWPGPGPLSGLAWPVPAVQKRFHRDFSIDFNQTLTLLWWCCVIRQNSNCGKNNGNAVVNFFQRFLTRSLIELMPWGASNEARMPKVNKLVMKQVVKLWMALS